MSAALVEGINTRSALPEFREMSAAFRAETGDRPGDHFITRLAMALAQLHRMRLLVPSRLGEIDRRRTELMILIDEWVSKFLQLGSGASLAGVVGPAADELAAAHVVAEQLLNGDTVGQKCVDDAWQRIGFLAVRWNTCISELVAAQPDGGTEPEGC